MGIRISIDNNSFNIVDTNNVLVGYSPRDIIRDCCEFASAHFSSIPRDFKQKNIVNITDHHFKVFDEDYTRVYNAETMDFFYEDGSMAEFKLIDKNGDSDPVYVCIHNKQNGYYSHGFKFQQGDEIIFKGYL